MTAYTLNSGAVGGVVCYGDLPQLPLTDDDRTIHAKVHFGTVEEVDYLFRVGRLRLSVIDVGSSTYKFAAIKSFSGGSITAIGTTTVVADTTYDVYATWDRSTATVALIVNGTEEATAEDAAVYVNTPNLPTFSANLPGSSWCTELACWGTVIEVGGGGTDFFGLIEMYREFWVEAQESLTSIGDNGTANSSMIPVNGSVGYSATAIGGRPAWDFTGDASMCLRTTVGSPGNDFTVFHVIKMNSTGAGDTIADAGTQNDAYVSEEGGQWRCYNRTTTDVSGGTSDLDPHILMVHFKTNATKLYVDGTVVATDSSCTTGAPTGMAVGGNYAGTDSFNGFVAYSGMYVGDLTADPGYADWLAAVKAYYGIS